MKRLTAWVLIAACLFSALPAYAASFAASRAAIRYGGVVYKIGQTSTKWKANLGSYKRKLNETRTIDAETALATPQIRHADEFFSRGDHSRPPVSRPTAPLSGSTS